MAYTNINTLRHVVSHYIIYRRERSTKELRWFAIQRTLDDAVSLAARAKKPSGKRFSHQRRIPMSVLSESEHRLLRILPALRQARSFEKLHKLVSLQIQPIKGIGELTIYDTSLRIAAKLGLEPSVVFLHAGTRIGAERLGIDASRETVSVTELPAPMRRLRPREIEDVLCIYKDQFAHKRGSSLKNLTCHA